jgi:hypothetical protein
MSAWRKTLPGSPFEVIEAEFLFHLLMGLLANPPCLDGSSQSAQIGRSRQIGEVVLPLSRQATSQTSSQTLRTKPGLKGRDSLAETCFVTSSRHRKRHCYRVGRADLAYRCANLTTLLGLSNKETPRPIWASQYSPKTAPNGRSFIGDPFPQRAGQRRRRPHRRRRPPLSELRYRYGFESLPLRQKTYIPAKIDTFDVSSPKWSPIARKTGEPLRPGCGVRGSTGHATGDHLEPEAGFARATKRVNSSNGVQFCAAPCPKNLFEPSPLSLQRRQLVLFAPTTLHRGQAQWAAANFSARR